MRNSVLELKVVWKDDNKFLINHPQGQESRWSDSQVYIDYPGIDKLSHSAIVSFGKEIELKYLEPGTKRVRIRVVTQTPLETSQQYYYCSKPGNS